MSAPGDMLGANIRLERPLGAGGMGSVWIARHLSLDTDVAVKFMSPELASNDAMRERFSREAMAMAQVKSPNIVQVFDHGLSADGVPYIVMELLSGEDLHDRLARIGRISLSEAVQIARQSCRALARAHQVKIVHRDIKPSNLFLTEADGEIFVKVLDFGIARSSSSAAPDGMTRTGALMGTPHYMSPEQVLSSKDVDGRADLWSLAVVLYEALTGVVPFDGETLGAVNVAIYAGKFIPPTQRVPTLPSALDTFFARALAREIGERFASAKEFADALVGSVPREARSVVPPREADGAPASAGEAGGRAAKGDTLALGSEAERRVVTAPGAWASDEAAAAAASDEAEGPPPPGVGAPRAKKAAVAAAAVVAVAIGGWLASRGAPHASAGAQASAGPIAATAPAAPAAPRAPQPLPAAPPAAEAAETAAAASPEAAPATSAPETAPPTPARHTRRAPAAPAAHATQPKGPAPAATAAPATTAVAAPKLVDRGF